MNETELFMNYIPDGDKRITSKPDISNLSGCIEDIKSAALDSDSGPQDPVNYNDLKKRLEASKQKVPALYCEAVFNPFFKTLSDLGEEKFNNILASDPSKEGTAGLMLDIAHAILQNGEGYNERATDSFEEVVSDLYDGFLGAEDRQRVKPPDMGIIPPLVKWGNPLFGAYTWPINATLTFGVGAAIVNLPPANAKRGIMAWSSLAHETGGHDILHADTGLLSELKEAVWNGLKSKNFNSILPQYWTDRIDETASDVLGVLNMGPAAGIGLIGYFRGLNLAFTGKAVLRNVGPLSDPHPADILRGYLASSSVGLLEFSGSKNWASIIEDETNKDYLSIQLAGRNINIDEARESALIVASTIMRTKLKSLENHALAQIQNWHDSDENIARILKDLLSTETLAFTKYERGTYAAHVVAAAVVKALEKDSNLPLIFERMQTILKTMHDANPSWGPLFVTYPGDITPQLVYRNYTNNNNAIQH